MTSMEAVPESPASSSGSSNVSASLGKSAGNVGKAMLVPLALAQFLASYANTSLNVSISNIAQDLGTSLTSVQTAITFYTLVMATLMITGSKLTDIWGRKRTFTWGIIVFAVGAAVAAMASSVNFIYLGYSLLQGIGTAMLIPPIYILVTVSIDDLRARAAAFGVIGAMAGLGSAAGPLIGGVITTAISWRATFVSQILVCAVILFLSRRIVDPGVTGPKPKLDILGVILSAAGMGLIVYGLLQAGTYGWLRSRQDFMIGNFVLVPEGGISPVWILAGAGFLLLLWFYFHIRSQEKKGKEPLVHTHVLKNRIANLGLVTQASQWFMLIGTSFVVSIFFQVAGGYSAIQTGLFLMPCTVGVLLSSWRAGPLNKRYSPRTLLRVGFIIAVAGIGLMLLMGDATGSGWLLAPGLFAFGIGMGIVMTPSVNVVQSSMPEKDQGEISGVSRSISNLGSSLGTAVAGAVLISALILGVTSLTEASTVLPAEDKEQIEIALQGQVSALSDAQVTAALEGQPEEIVDEVVAINAAARDRALGLALLSIGIVGLAGLGAALLFPKDIPSPSLEDAAQSNPA